MNVLSPLRRLAGHIARHLARDAARRRYAGRRRSGAPVTPDSPAVPLAALLTPPPVVPSHRANRVPEVVGTGG